MEMVICGRFGSDLVWTESVAASRDDIKVECVLDVGRLVRCTEYPLVVGLVFGEQQGRIAVAMKQIAADLGVLCLDSDRVLSRHPAQGGFLSFRPPCPSVAKPQGRQNVQRGIFRPPVADAD